MDYNLWQIFAGIGLFLFGMLLLEQSIRKLAGRSFKIFLKKHTEHPFKAVLAGLIITALLQSSSIVNLLVLAFVGARILTMHNAIAVILGANLGSTVYNWIVVLVGFKFDIQDFAFPMMAIATIGLLFFQNHKKIMHWTTLVFGLSLLFMGLANIKIGVEDVVNAVDLSRLNEYGNIVFVAAGFILTTIVQSSSATVVITLSALNAGVISFEAAACLVIGSESGTAVKTILGGLGKDADKKRVAMGNLIINVTSSVVAYLLLHPITWLIKSVFHLNDPLFGLVAFQSIININGIILFYPFLKPFSRFLEKRFDNKNMAVTYYLNRHLVSDPEEAIKAIRKESRRLMFNILLLNRKAFEIKTDKQEHIPENLKIHGFDEMGYSESYETIKQLNGEIIEYCLDVRKNDTENIYAEQLENLIIMLRQVMNAAKSVKDIRHNIKEFRDSADDTIHEYYLKIKEREETFETKIMELILDEQNMNLDKITEYRELNKFNHNKAIQGVYLLAENESIRELEMTTLVNVYDEIQSAHVSMSKALEEINCGKTSNGQ